jgi:PHP family Zn ribbon phosphoesterase
MREFLTDLHIHTALSPCAAEAMTPANIIACAQLSGLDIIAITDHNASDNVAAVMEAAKGTTLTVFPGMEIETREEIHLIVLFGGLEEMSQWEHTIREYRPRRLNDEQKFGPQYIMNAAGNITGIKPEMLLMPLNCSLGYVTRQVRLLGGLCIASHVDRPAYSILSQLGFISAELQLDAVEISRRVKGDPLWKTNTKFCGLTVVTASDAHTLEDLLEGPRTKFVLEAPTVAELRKALYDQEFRKVLF